MVSLPFFYTKRPKRLPKSTRFELFLKRRSPLNQPFNNDNITASTSTLQNFILPCYSTVNSNPNDYPLNSKSENESLVKVYSKTNYPFFRHLFGTDISDFLLLELEILPIWIKVFISLHTKKSTALFFKIELHPPLKKIPIIEIPVHCPNNPTVKVRVLALSPKIHDKSTR